MGSTDRNVRSGWTGKSISGLAFLGTLAFLLGLLVWTRSGTCTERVVTSSRSPSAKWELRTYFTDCGFLRGYTTRLALRAGGDAFLPGPRGLVDSGLVLVAGKMLPVRVEWAGDDTLSLSCMGCRKTAMFWVRTHGKPEIRLFDSAGTVLDRP